LAGRTLQGGFCFLAAPLWLALLYSALPAITSFRAWVAWPVDLFGGGFATSECLAEHLLERLSPKKSNVMGRLPLQLEAFRRHGTGQLATAQIGLKSYRAKVTAGRVALPDALRGLQCPQAPVQLRELQDWAADARAPRAVRVLAARAREAAIKDRAPIPAWCH
jgi:hypothetical protein